MHSLGRQRGISFFNLLIVLLVGGIFFTVGFKLFTPYADHETFKSILESITEDREEMKKDLSTIKRNIDRRFTINQVRLPKYAPDGETPSLLIKQKESEVFFTLDYEIRVPMFYNVDAVVEFKEEYVATKP